MGAGAGMEHMRFNNQSGPATVPCLAGIGIPLVSDCVLRGHDPRSMIGFGLQQIAKF